MRTWDVAVIGGGPAGSTAAALLADSALRVIVLEKGTFPRDKVCGEFLSPAGIDLLLRLGVWPRVSATQPQIVRAFVLTTRRHDAQCPLPWPGLGISRWTLDRLLWEHAQASGAVTWDRSAVVKVQGDFARGFSLEVQRPSRPPERVHARSVICAAGRQWRSPRGATVARPSLRQGLVGLKAHFYGVHLDQRVELHAVPRGYCGVAEVEGERANLCCLVRADAFRRAGGTPDRLFDHMLQENPRLRARMAGARRVGPHWLAVSFAYRKRAAPVDDGIWRIGDSAAMIAPLTGDGMSMALRSAEIAAATLRAAFGGHLTWERAAAAYVAGWRRVFSRRLWWGERLERTLLSPQLAGLACLVLNLMPALMGPVYRCTRDIVPLYPGQARAGMRNVWP